MTGRFGSKMGGMFLFSRMTFVAKVPSSQFTREELRRMVGTKTEANMQNTLERAGARSA